jgi:rubrerythrin
VTRSIVVPMDTAPEVDECRLLPTSKAESKRLPCDACGTPMEPEHAHYRCPACGYILPCCGW